MDIHRFIFIETNDKASVERAETINSRSGETPTHKTYTQTV